MTSNQATPRFTGTPAVPHMRGQSGKRRRHKVQSGRHWVGRAGRGGAEPRSRRGVGVRWAHCGSFLREVSLPPRCQEPLVPRQEGTYVYLWLTHVDVLKPTKFCKAIILQLKINFF